MRIFTNLDLNDDAPTRVQPIAGEWGPVEVVSTRAKRRARWLWVIAFVLVTTVIFVFGHWVYGLLMNSGG